MKTSQLQIRVTPEEKQALKRLAEAAGESLSTYVLSRALPTVNRELAAAVGELAQAGGHLAASGSLRALLRDLSGDELLSPAARPDLDGLPPLARNVVAGLVEEAAHDKGVEPPEWAETVAPLDRPHFRWALESLQPHQLRVTPAPFKRRNLFFDPTSRVVESDRHDPPQNARGSWGGLERLNTLRRELQALELNVEFYLVHGAFFAQAFQARPHTAHISALFKPSEGIQEAAARVATREGWPYDWLSSAVKTHLTGGRGRYVELPGMRALAPPLGYVLAIKVAALRLGPDPRVLDDVRYLLRAGDITSADVAYETVRRYFGERQLPSDAHSVLEELIG